MQKQTQQGNSRSVKSFPHRPSTLSISIGSTSIPMSAGQVKKLAGSDWTHCHGTASDGTPVNSLSIGDAADSLLIRDGSGRLLCLGLSASSVLAPHPQR